ncbi:MAG: FAD-dependent oxidoreductase, partial [Acutalibacteraceae bacterium]
MDNFGLIVAGGGLTGVAAAVAAARRGIRVLLLEKENCLGGAAANNLVFPFMPYITSVNGKKVDLSAGFFKELTDALEDAGAVGENRCDFDAEYLKLILNRKALKEGITILFGAFVTACKKEGDRVTAVKAQTKSGEMTLYADMFIDATGDADLSALAGVPFEVGREEDGLCQPMTLCFKVGNVDPELYNAEEQNRINRAYREYKASPSFGDAVAD